MGNEGGRPSCVRLRFIVWSFNTRARHLNDGGESSSIERNWEKDKYAGDKKQTSFCEQMEWESEIKPAQSTFCVGRKRNFRM